jgi:hypothetical protein
MCRTGVAKRRGQCATYNADTGNALP